MSTTAERVHAIIASQLVVDPATVTPQAKLGVDLHADSLDHVDLLITFEADFGISIPNDEWDTVVTVADAIAAVQRHAGA